MENTTRETVAKTRIDREKHIVRARACPTELFLGKLVLKGKRISKIGKVKKDSLCRVRNLNIEFDKEGREKTAGFFKGRS